MVWGNNLMASADLTSLKYSLPWMVRIFITVLQLFLVLKRSHAAEGVRITEARFSELHTSVMSDQYECRLTLSGGV